MNYPEEFYQINVPIDLYDRAIEIKIACYEAGVTPELTNKVIAVWVADRQGPRIPATPSRPLVIPDVIRTPPPPPPVMDDDDEEAD